MTTPIGSSDGAQAGPHPLIDAIEGRANGWGAPGQGAPRHPDAILAWAIERWWAEVKNRPLVNVHRRTLDSTWRQVIRHFGGDPEALVGPSHDDLLDAAVGAEPTPPIQDQP